MRVRLPFILCLTSFAVFAQNATNSISKSVSQKQQIFISFTENKGQVSDQNYKPRQDVLFGGSVNGMVFHLRTNGISYQLNRIDSWKESPSPTLLKSEKLEQVPDQSTVYRLDVNWLNCNAPVKIATGEALPGCANYYLESCPNGVHNVKSYNDVTYQNIYSGIDLKWYEKDDNLKYDYLVAAGADYKKIQLEIKGADKIILNIKGELVIQTPLGNIIEQAPLVKQNGKILIAKWVIKNNIISYDIKNINPKEQFIIDPGVRAWGTFYGDIQNDYAYACTTDASNNAYATGFTNTSTGTMIATVGSHQAIFGGSSWDAFLVKFNSAGVRQWATYYGGAGDDFGRSCSADALGNIYLAGDTDSNVGTAIATVGSHQSINGGLIDAFLIKFNSSGVRQWGTYYGDTGNDYGYSCATDPTGNIYLAGYVPSGAGTVIATPGSHQSTFGGIPYDGYLVKFNTAGVRQWGTFYGGVGNDIARYCATDAAGNVFLAGNAETLSGTAIASVGSHQAIHGGGFSDAFLVKFNSAGVRQWGTYYGGVGPTDYGYACSADAAGNIYLEGYTDSNTGTVIATAGAHQSIYGGGTIDAFLVKFNSVGVRQWGTYYGGSGSDYGRGCATDVSGNIYLAGYTDTGTGTVIATPGSHQPIYAIAGGSPDAYVALFNSSGVRQWGTYYGGTGNDYGFYCATDAAGSVYLTGYTDANTGTVIATPGSHQPNYAAGTDVYLVKLNDCSSPALPVNTTPPLNQSICANNTTTLTATGSGTISWFATPTSTSVLITGTTYITPTLSAGMYTFYIEALTCAPSVTRTPVTLTVNPNPTITVNGGSICIGQSFTIIPNGANSYTIQGGTPIVSPTITTNYTIVGTSTAGCVSQTSAISNIIVNPNPTITVNSGSICSGQSFTMVPSGANTFTFQGGSAIVSPTTNSSYTITGTSTAGCVSSNTAISNVTVNQTPNVIANITVGCVGQNNGVITLSVTGGTPGYTYLWSPVVSTSSVATNLGSGIYNYTVTDANNCSSSQTSPLTADPLPSINASTSNTLLCIGQSATLTASGAITFTWNPGGVGTSIIVSPITNTTYTITGTDTNGCTNTIGLIQMVDPCTSISKNINSVTQPNIYPNPFNNKITIVSDTKQSVQIFNTLGSLIHNTMIENEKTEIDLSNQANGIYFIRIGSAIKKIVKQD